MTGTFGTVRRDDHIPSGPPQFDQRTKGSGPAPRTRPANRLMPELGNDARDNFSVAMTTDQHVGTRSSVADRNHQLLGMPKSQYNVATLPIQRIDGFMATRLTAHRTRHTANCGGSKWRQQRAFHPLFNSLLQTLPRLLTHHLSPVYTLVIS